MINAKEAKKIANTETQMHDATANILFTEWWDYNYASYVEGIIRTRASFEHYSAYLNVQGMMDSLNDYDITRVNSIPDVEYRAIQWIKKRMTELGFSVESSADEITIRW